MKTTLLFLALGVTSCNHRRATREDCQQILDRIVALELRERGFRDSALLERKSNELRQTLAPELSQCWGRRLSEKALACIRTAESTEQLTHACLR